MDHIVRWSPEAVEDIEAITEYIARDSEYYARSIVTEILSVSRHIAEFPHIGRCVPELSDENIRERFIHNYRLIYRIETECILIASVIHGKRLLENVEDRFE
ncbi:type II toxin-antitoxin system RelE/ParE family toxin [Marinicella gelatinilytica]|uniref:type II toxin-antitoxin system RelE/ParE family toxin n=1 Tax=Marinicella gelatinilytica TaxID=2996017 RepID=UPI003899337E